ncbi:TrmB family transcriptional regulator [Mesorhizobium sp. M1004]|uniref:phospholipase D-like domain-containing protein n=1 Tax=Mesorhizobium sp. M1004 TaxID=2957046 RepID=UPI003339E0B0
MKNLPEEEKGTIHLVYPLLRGSKKFKLERGRRWSVVEHLLLRTVCDVGLTADDLSKSSQLPRRVIVEAFTRLMRAGWVEIRTSGKNLLFKATEPGKRNAKLDNLPSVIVPDARWITYYIDDLTGCVFRWRDVINRSRKDLPTNNAGQHVHMMPRKGVVENLAEIYRVLESGDELIVGSFPSASGASSTFGLITFRNGLPEGIPKGASQQFLDLVAGAYLEAQTELSRKGTLLPAAVISRAGENASPARPRVGIFENGDLILDDQGHRQTFEGILGGAQDRVIIHSTFVSDNAKDRLPALLQAASRKVRVDIFFGQGDDPAEKENSSQLAMRAMHDWIGEHPFREYIRMHHLSTGSHAKFMVANDRRMGWIGVVGSCNWLATRFDSFEASVRLRDRLQVAELVNSLSMMSVGRKSIWNETAQELATLSREIQSSPEKSGRRVPMWLLYTEDHAKVPIDARDRYQRRAFVTSHRIGVAGKAVTLYPLIAGTKNKDEDHIEVFAYYGRTTGAMSGIEATQIAREYASAGLSLRPVQRPRLHAKVLGWDSNCLAVSSFNWLSVDPSEKKPFNEIGVFIESTRIADTFINAFESAQWG